MPLWIDSCPFFPPGKIHFSLVMFVDDDRAVVYVHELLGDVLPHAVAGPAGDDECIVHIVVSVFFMAKITQISEVDKALPVLF